MPEFITKDEAQSMINTAIENYKLEDEKQDAGLEEGSEEEELTETPMEEKAEEMMPDYEGSEEEEKAETPEEESTEELKKKMALKMTK